jgi:DNA repair exonuclease SbcCD ATPase subunit
MSGKKWGLILGAMILIGFTVFSSVHYYTLLDQNRILQRLVRSYEKKLTDMEQARKAMEEQLTQEKNVLDQQLKEAQEQLKQVTEELSLSKDKVTTLEKANSDLLEMQKELQNKIGVIALEKETLQAKFNSLEELKKAIRDLKEKIRQEKLAKRKEQQDKQLTEGNRGYLIYQGVSTSRGKVKIEVIPVP